MDSAAMLFQLKDFQHEVRALSFDYGQRHLVELSHAAHLADQARIPWEVANLSAIQPLLGGSSQTDPSVAVPEGHYEDESMKVTVVPNRNMLMASVAAARAISLGYDGIAMAMHAGDHAIYPDCRPAFAQRLSNVLAVAHYTPVSLVTPFIRLSKADIVRIGHGLRVPWHLTWSCYKGEAKHCGKCGTCVERREAFELAGIDDPTEYADGNAVCA